MKLAKKYTDDVLDGFTEQERETIFALLSRMVENVERHIPTEESGPETANCREATKKRI
jgi:hypothetical protein